MNINPGYAYLIVFLVSFLVVFFITPKVARKVKESGITGADANKAERPSIPKIGGVAILLGFSIAILLSLQLESMDINHEYMLAAICSITLVAVMGLLDDLLELPDRYKVLLPLFAAIPLMVIKAGTSTMSLIFFTVNFNLGVYAIPLLGPVDINLYSLLLIPLGVVACSNLVNLLAGFNGLEAGNGAIISFSLFTASILLGNMGLHTMEASFLMIALFGACLAFLSFNWYPARIFPGNVATFMIGAAVVAAVVTGNMERIGVICLTPQIIEFLLKARSPGFSAENFGRVGKKGRLYYTGRVYSLTHLLMKTIHPTEKQLVIILLVFQALCGAVAVWSIYW
jgi:UDP-N-acetylglucosamine--dolichyl-phosphate N-acetylglucosaminephosphotransferase